jgi:hypothetical protein
VVLSTTTGHQWPSRAAYLAASVFIAASGATNIAYGWQKGSDLVTSLVWAGVSAGVAIIFALSWPAMIKSLDGKRYSAALIALVAMLLSGAYSVTAALGSAAGGRMNAAASETATTDARAKAQAAYDVARGEIDALGSVKPGTAPELQIVVARAELAKLPAARSVAELEALQKRGCQAGIALKGQLKTKCSDYSVETARAWERQRVTNRIAELVKDADRAEQRHVERRDRAQAAMDRASAELAAIRPARQANADSKALARYLAAVGLEITPDRLNDLLVLLAVLMIEAGGGISLALGMALSLSGDDGHAPDTQASTRTPAPTEQRTPSPDTSENPKQSLDLACPPPPDTSMQPGQDTTDRSAAGVRFLSFLRDRGGVLVSGQRQIGRALGWSKSWTHEVLHDLAGAGLVQLTTGKSGTIVRLPAAA